MKKLLLFLTAFGALQAWGQITSFGCNSISVPQYMGSTQGGSTRLPVVYRLNLIGLAPNSPYKYITQGIVSSDLSSADLLPGAGDPVFLDSGSWKMTSSPSFNNASGHDTIYSSFAGDYQGWFGFVYNTDTRFSAGNEVYPYLALVGIKTGDTFRLYCTDSMHVLAFGSNNSADTGTGIWGHSLGTAKNFVALYSNTSGTGRPLSQTMIENDALSIGSSAVTYYKNSVEAVSGNWGAIIPNNNSNGVKLISRMDRYTGFGVFGNTDADGVWSGSSAKNTVNPTGGTTAIALTEDDAPLVAPDIQFWARTSTVNETAGTKEIYVTRKYSNDQAQSVRLTIVGGTAIEGSSNDYELLDSQTLTFQPGKMISDTITVKINDDASAEGDETIVLRLDNPSNCVIGTEVAHTITIKDDDIAIISPASKLITAKETDGTVGIKLRVNRAVSNASSVRLIVKSKGVLSYIPGEFSLGSSTVDSVFNIGNNSGPDSITINAKIFDDVIGDPHDTFVIALRQVTGSAQIVDSVITIIVRDNDGPAIIRFVGNSLTVNEKATSAKVRVEVLYKTDGGGDFTFRLLSSGSTASESEDFTFSPTSQIINIDANTPDTIDVSIPILDDDKYEATEKILFNLGNLANVTVQKPDSFNVFIVNDDYPIYSIGTISKQTKAARTMDSANVKCRIEGVVHGINLRTAGLQFTLIDKTGGISILSAGKSFGYTVNEGDSLRVQGIVGQVNGLGVFQSLDTIIKIGINKALQTPAAVNDVNEATENQMAKFNRVKLVDASKWPTSALSVNGSASIGVLHTDGTVDTLFIDAETNIDGTTAPAGYFNVTGIGGQSDASSPFTAGYYLAPRRLSDFEASALPVIRFLKATDTITELADSFRIDLNVAPLDENFTFDVVVKGGTAVSPTDYNFNTRTISVIKNNSVNSFKVNISDDANTDGQKTLLFAIRNVVGPGSISADSVLALVINDDEVIGVKRIAGGNIKIYPNPANTKVRINATFEITDVKIFSLDGRKVYSNSTSSKQHVVDLTSFAKGVYSIQLTNADGEMYSDQLIVQ